MRLKVPFVKSSMLWKGKNLCGPIALASILKYYKVPFFIKDIAKGARYRKETGTTQRGLVYYCLSKKMKVSFIYKYTNLKNNRKEFSKRIKEFYKKAKAEESDKILIKKCERFKFYKHIRKKPTLKDIEKFIKERKPVLIALNIAKVYNKKELWLHYIVIVGCDKNNFYVHNIHPKNIAYEKISKKLFQKAWAGEGLDRVLIIPYI